MGAPLKTDTARWMAPAGNRPKLILVLWLTELPDLSFVTYEYTIGGRFMSNQRKHYEGRLYLAAVMDLCTRKNVTYLIVGNKRARSIGKLEGMRRGVDCHALLNLSRMFCPPFSKASPALVMAFRKKRKTKTDRTVSPKKAAHVPNQDRAK